MRLEGIRRVHLLGIAGSGMASLAGLLQASGYEVRGSDEGVYPPASTLLEEMGVPFHRSWSPAHLEPTPDLVVVGNAVMRGNPELEAVLDADLPYLSMPETLRWLWLRERRRVVVAGTHGKTTVTTVLAWLLHGARPDAGWLIGGTPLGLERPFAPGATGAPFVLEGDEYDTAFFDKGPKFLHYRPHLLVLNNVEYDHADIYADEAAYRFAFERLCMLPPSSGRLIVGGESPTAIEVSRRATCPVETFGLGEGHDWGAVEVSADEAGVRFTLTRSGTTHGEVRFPMTGDYSVRNALAAYACATALGLDEDGIRKGLASFPGVRRRMELRGEASGVRVVDDFAHHPTAIREVLAAARMRFPRGRLLAAFEPRSWSCRRRTHQEAFPEAFAGADLVLIAPVHGAESLPAEERLDPVAVAEELTCRDTPARAAGSVDEILARLLEEARAGDTILVLSNGSFDGLHERLLTALVDRQEKEGKTP